MGLECIDLYLLHMPRSGLKYRVEMYLGAAGYAEGWEVKADRVIN
jgi:hypothetical protein